MISVSFGHRIEERHAWQFEAPPFRLQIEKRPRLDEEGVGAPNRSRAV
jgi:hypothetical protein